MKPTLHQKIRAYFAEMPGFVQLELQLFATLLISGGIAWLLLWIMSLVKR